MKKILSLLVFLFAITANAQIVFEKGYFINNAGVRTECYIKNVDWRDNPSAFEYKINPEDAAIKTETITGIEEFGIGNLSRYKRFKVKMERSENTITSLKKNKLPEWVEETHFLKVLISGDATLFVYAEGNLTKYFYETKTTPIEQLIYIKYISNEDNVNGANSYSESIRENNQFRQQLLNNVKCGDMSEKDFKNLRYDKSSLVRIFEKYNSCNPSPVVNFVENDKRKTFTMRIVPGIYVAKLDVSDPEQYWNKNSDFTNVVFKIGVEAEYILPFNKSSWSVFIAPAYQKFSTGKYFSSSDNLKPIPKQVDYYATADYSAVEIPVGVRHYFSLKGHSKIFVNAAYVFTASFGDSKLNFESEPATLNADDHLDMSGRSNLALGVGYAYKNFNVEFRANFAREVLSGYISWSGKYTSNGINLGYTFL